MPRIKKGQIFAVPVRGKRYALGQIIDPGIVFYCCFFDQLFKEDEAPPESLDGLRLLLVGRTTDAGFFHGTWKHLGVRGLVHDIPRPCHVVFTPDGLALKDFYGKTLREADEADFDFFGYETTHSPAAFEDALKNWFRNKKLPTKDRRLGKLTLEWARKRDCRDRAVARGSAEPVANEASKQRSHRNDIEAITAALKSSNRRSRVSGGAKRATARARARK
jgi:hypothetical protein